MDNRLELQDRLERISGGNKVYFDPPSNIRMDYPCIKYELAFRDAIFADGERYLRQYVYTVTIIDKSYTSAVATCEKIEKEFTYARFDRTYVADGLHHYVYKLTL